MKKGQTCASFIFRQKVQSSRWTNSPIFSSLILRFTSMEVWHFAEILMHERLTFPVQTISCKFRSLRLKLRILSRIASRTARGLNPNRPRVARYSKLKYIHHDKSITVHRMAHKSGNAKTVKLHARTILLCTVIFTLRWVCGLTVLIKNRTISNDALRRSNTILTVDK